MKRYSAYKDSGVQWIGEVPGHWEMRRIKNIFTETKEKSVLGNETPLSLGKETGIIPSSEKKNKTMESTSYVGCKIVCEGDIVFNRFKARLFAISSYNGIISPDYAIYKCSKVANPQYIVQLLGTEMYRAAFDRKASGVGDGFSRLYTDDLFSFYAIFPPLTEQRAIVDYLKDKTSKIDQYVSERERERELLDSLKQSEIANVVTKGLNPNAKMKDSGIPWIGEIPEHWEVKKLRNFIKLVSIKGHGDKPLLSVTREQGVIERNTESKEENHNFIPDDLSGYKLVQVGQFVINKMKSWQGSYGVSEYEGIVSPAYYVCDLDFPCKEYFSLAIRSKAYVPFFTQYSKGIRVDQWDLSPIGLRSIPFIVPPLSEQRAIVSYIDSKLQKIDQYMADLQSEIDYLKEFKQRLISDAVTGQICVTTEKGEPNE